MDAVSEHTKKEPAAVWVQTSELVPWDKNPRDNRLAVDRVAASIKRFGFGAPLLARAEDRVLIAGHTRLQAAKQLGIEQVPVRYLDLDPADAALLAMADNKLGEIAEWDTGALAALLVDLAAQGADVLESGFDQGEIDALLRAASTEPLEAEDPGAGPMPPEPQSVPGELYELGPHRLLCGDATCVTDLERLMDGEKARLVFTDPPYNVAYEGSNGKTIKNDDMNSSEFKTFLLESFSSMLAVSDAGSAIYVCHADLEGVNFRSALVESGWLLKSCIVWVKDSLVLGRADFHWRHEPILYGWAPGESHRWFGDRKQTTVWEFDKPRRNEEHPTMKPTELVQHAVELSSAKGDPVLDSFGGSGTTLIACAKAGRKARLLELDPRYCDVIRRRWTKFAKSAGVDSGPGSLE